MSLPPFEELQRRADEKRPGVAVVVMGGGELTVLHALRTACDRGWVRPRLTGSAGTELLKPAPDDVLQRLPVSKRVNSSRADASDATLIDKI